MAFHPIWITEKDVTEMIGLPEAIEALEATLVLEAAGTAANMPKSHLMVAPNDAMHAIGASVAGEGICGFKTWVNVGGKSETTVTLFSLEDGACLAVIEATALGQMRTASMTGVGTRLLAPAGADELAIVGTGKQALPQIAAVHAVRTLKSARVWSRNPATRRRFAEEASARLDIRVLPAESLEEAVAQSPIVTLMTNSTEPFLSADMLAQGCHLNALGAIVPARVEFHGDVFERVDAIVVDSVQGVKDLSLEFRARFGEGDGDWSQVQSVASAIASGQGRPAGADVTLFKTVGMGISDLALAIAVYKRALSDGRGHPAPERIKLPPRLLS